MRRFLAVAAGLLLLCAALAAQAAPATTYVDITDQAYRDIDKLVAFGLCRPPIADQRPFTRGEFARLLAMARSNWAKQRDGEADETDYKVFARSLARRRYIDRIIERLTTKFSEELVAIGAIEGERAFIRGHPFDELRLDTIFASSAPLVIQPNNGYGTINAVVNPFLDYREGRHAVDGVQTAFEIDNRFTFGRHFAIAFRPRVESDSWRNGDALIRPYLQDGYGVLQFGDAALTFGRKSVVWGPGEHGGLLFSNNPRPMDLIEFSTPSPFQLPWVFKYLGEWRISMLGANMGPENPHPYWWLGAWRLSLMPVRY
ncbi:MAG: capsule assembly Wzi family protein, partial [bacterium]